MYKNLGKAICLAASALIFSEGMGMNATIMEIPNNATLQVDACTTVTTARPITNAGHIVVATTSGTGFIASTVVTDTGHIGLPNDADTSATGVVEINSDGGGIHNIATFINSETVPCRFRFELQHSYTY